MKKLIITSLLSLFFLNGLHAQTIQMVGSSPTLTKGTIDTELLTEIIQQKQEEVKERAFRNLIVKWIKGNDRINSISNFTTYYYLYNVMDNLLSAKNKTSITKALTESTAEFAYVYGFAIFYLTRLNNGNCPVYLDKYPKFCDKLTDENKSLNEVNMLFAKGDFSNNKIRPDTYTIPSQKIFNLVLDVCFDVVLNDTTSFSFKKDTNNLEFKRWYKSDNVYISELETYKNDKDSVDLKALHDSIDTAFTSFKTLINDSKKIIDTLNLVKNNLKSNDLQTDFTDLILNIDEKNVTNKLKGFAKDLSKPDSSSVLDLEKKLDNDFLNYKNMIQFYIGLKKSDFQDFTLTKDQYYSMKYIVSEFINMVKNKTKHDVVASVLEFMLENTIIEYTDDKNNRLTEENAEPDSSKGYLYVDVEALITAIDEKLTQPGNRGVGVYFTPFFSIGTNYGYFTNNNNVLNNGQGLQNMYFASEKIGVKWKIWNWKYTHSFESGQNFKYLNQFNFINPCKWNKNKWNPNKYWKRPQQKTFLNDVHVLAYGSGLLYNIASLNSEKSFTSPIFGAGLGTTFFNGLSLNVSYASPFTNHSLSTKNGFVNIGFDIPIVEYIAALKKKRSN